MEALSYPFFQRVLVAGLLASIAAGVMGSYVVIKRISSVTGGLAHAAFGGVGLGYLAGFDPILGATGFGLLSGLGIGLSYRRLRASLDTAISIVWSAGMALGIVLVSMSPGYAPDLTSYLFGSILFASWDYVLLVGLLDLAIVVTAFLLFDALQAASFDEEFSETLGIPVDRLLLLLLALVSLTVVTLIRVVGVILAIALMTIPATTARQWCVTLSGMMTLAATIAAVCTAAGLFGSFWLSDAFGLNVPSGPLIILLAVIVYGGSHVLLRMRRGGTRSAPEPQPS